VIHALSAGGARIMLVLVTRTMNGVLPAGPYTRSL
jgi:hypothetical protein